MAQRSPPVFDPQGGFDCDFVESPPNRLCCDICRHPLRNPLLTSCGHSLCTYCHRTRFLNSQLCPICKIRYTTSPDANIARELKALQVRCRNKQGGCKWTGDLGKLKEHMEKCEYANLRCTKCGQLMQQRLMMKHQVSLCPFRQYDCEYCRKYVSTYEDVSKNHWAVCEFFPEHCPNDCPKGIIPRNHLMDHIRSECKVKKDGKQLPEVKSQCADLLEEVYHLQESLERINKIMELRQELKEKDSKISEMEKEREELRKKIDQPSVTTSLFTTLGNVWRSLSRPGWEDDDPEDQKWRKELFKV